MQGSESDPGIGVIGAGYWGRNLVRSFGRVHGGRLIAVADLDPDRRAQAEQICPGVRLYPEAEALLADPDVDAVAVCTEASSHHRLGMAALQAGKHLFVEKPLALKVAHARELVDEADARDLRLMVGHLMLHHPAVQWIVERQREGAFGDLYYLYFQRLNLGVVRTDESAWWSLAPHDISIALNLLGGSPSEVCARGASYLRPQLEDVVFASLHFGGGQMAQIHTSWLDPHKIRKLCLVGSRKMVTFDDTEAQEKVRVYDKGAEPSADYDSYAALIALRQGDIWIPRIDGTELINPGSFAKGVLGHINLIIA